MSLDAASGNILLDLIQKALGPITKKLEVVRTRPMPTLWHDGRAESVSFVPGTTRPDKATWSYKNPLADTIAIRSFGLIFDDKPTDTWKPIVEVRIDEGIVFQSEGNPFANANLSIDLGTGRPLPRNRSLEVRLWNGSTDATAKIISCFAQAGEM